MSAEYALKRLPVAGREYKREYAWSVRQWGRHHADKYFEFIREKLAILKSSPYAYPKSPDGLYHIINLEGLRIAYCVNGEERSVTVLAFVGRNRFGELEGMATRRLRRE